MELRRRPGDAGLYLPQWSDLIRADEERYTAALYRSVARIRHNAAVTG